MQTTSPYLSQLINYFFFIRIFLGFPLSAFLFHCKKKKEKKKASVMHELLFCAQLREKEKSLLGRERERERLPFVAGEQFDD